MDTDAENLKALMFRDALDRIREESRWTQKAFARDEHGDGINYTSPDATCWCSSGSLALTSLNFEDEHKISEVTCDDYLNQLVVEMSARLFETGIVSIKCAGALVRFNDNYSHAEVIKFWEDFGHSKGYL